MPQRRVATLIIAGITVILAFASPAVAQTGRVSGIVRQEGGQPLKGATVTADNQDIGQTLTATTDDRGRFNMIGLRMGNWRFIAQAPGFAPQGLTAPIKNGSVNPPIGFELAHSGVAFFGALGGIVNKDLQADLTAADALYTQKKWDEAIAAYRTILTRVPVITAINLQIASAYRNKKDYDSALAAYNDILKAEPANTRAKIEIAMTALERGDARGAEETLTRAANEPDAPREVFYGLGEVKLAANDPDGAAAWFEKAAKADPFWAKPLLKLGEAAMKKGDNAGAARLLAKAVEVDPTAPEAAAAKTTLASLNK